MTKANHNKNKKDKKYDSRIFALTYSYQKQGHNKCSERKLNHKFYGLPF